MNDYQVIRENILFRDLSDSDVETLINISDKLDLDAGKVFIHEGDAADNFYYILEGKVAIIKTDPEHQNKHVIAHLERCETIGEISLLDQKPRSASAKTEEFTRLLRISFEKLKAFAKKSDAFSIVLSRISENLAGRIRQTNSVAVDALEKQIEEYKLRTGVGLFMINIIVCLCLYIFSLSWILDQMKKAVSSTTISLPMTVAFIGLFFSIMKTSGLPKKTFGLTTQNWRKAVIEAVFFSVIVCLFVVILKWVLIHTTVKYMGHAVFEPYLAIHVSKDSAWSTQGVWWTIFIIYWIAIAPLQELIVRGGLQGPLEVLLTGKNVVFKSIVISNLMFGTLHIFMSAEISIIVFWAGLYFGWLYARHRTLIGVIIAHGILGTWGLMVVGLT